MNLYLALKAIHIIAVISWMVGLLYLPRLFVYHVENNSAEASKIKSAGVLFFNSCRFIYYVWDCLEKLLDVITI